jgi:catalase
MRHLLLAATAASALAYGFASPARAQTAPAASAPSPVALIDALEGTFGKRDGFRRSHAKGICATGTFVGTPEGVALSRAQMFDGRSVPATLRFSVGGGNPMLSDKSRSVRGLAMALDLPQGQAFHTAMLSAPVFFVATPEQFVGFLQSRAPDPATRMPDPAKIAAFNAANPETGPQIRWLAANAPPASYASAAYHGINAFSFTNAAGQQAWVRWSFQPAGGTQGLTAEQMQAMPDNFLPDELRTRIAAAPAVFNMVVQVAEAGDSLTNPTVEWPAQRRSVTVGRLTVTGVSPDDGGACRAQIFNPLVLPAGIAPSADPTLQARPASYAVSAARRQ